jgi:hypothetical protein
MGRAVKFFCFQVPQGTILCAVGANDVAPSGLYTLYMLFPYAALRLHTVMHITRLRR